MNVRFPAILLAGLVIFGFELLIIIGINPGLNLKIAVGFLSLFFFPGYCLAEILLNRVTDWLDRLGFAVLFSFGIFSYPALLFFLLELDLQTVFWVFFLISLSIWMLFLFQTSGDLFQISFSPPALKKDFLAKAFVLAFAMGSSILAFYLGSYRRPGHDWDYYNYITMVRKFLVWGKASIHNYYYIDAPPDPIHSYNLQALLWALIARENRIDPVPLYVHSAFLTVPLCFIAFFGMARRVLSERGGFLAFCFYVFYQLFYGGLFFVRNSSFFPDDGMWLMAFPALINLTFLYLEKNDSKILPLLAFSSLGISIVHPLWGLAYYLVLFFYWKFELTITSKALQNIRLSSGNHIFSYLKYILSVLILSPYLLSIVYLIKKLSENHPNWFEPLFPGFFLDKLWFYVLVFMVMPFLLFIFMARPYSKLLLNFQRSEFYINGYHKKALLVIILCLLIASPYIYLRWQTIQYTQWSSFGRNPYRGLLTPNLFLLNPLKRSFLDPNISFHPFFWFGLVFSPWLLWLGRRDKKPGALAVFYSLVAIVALVLHPVLATIFSEFFSLGYLRRILRLPALLAFLAPAAFLEWVFLKYKLKNIWANLLGIVISCVIGLSLIPIPGDTLYYRLFKEMRLQLKPEYQETLFWDDAPFKFLKEKNLVQPDDVIYSDIFTSFRATAYLDCYVAVQLKPGVGVPDQDQRRLEEMVFFSPDTSPELMLKILQLRNADWVIINRNPQYVIPAYDDLALSHPEAISKLNGLGDLEKIYDRGDWVVFKLGISP